MVDASTDNPTSSPEPPAADVAAAKNNTSDARPAGKPNSAGAHLTAAATIDELLAKEALANLKRTRATTHAENVKSKARVPIPAATLVVKPPQSHAWVTPFVTLAALFGITTVLCAGGLAYLYLRPSAAVATSDAELRNIRESVAQLRRTVATLSTELATNRAALDAANKAANDRFGRIVQSLDRVDRDQSVSATRIERMAEEKAHVVRPAPPAPTPEITGTVQRQPRPTTARRDVLAGWRVRRAFEGVAILEGQPGVIEVVLGQEVPNLGRIEEIKYENNHWQVLTSRGVILPAR
jgi:cell division protein FtsB